MIAPAQTNRYPYDTGCSFHGVRVRLECEHPSTAAALGERLAQKGLAHETPSRLMTERLVGKRVILGQDMATGQQVYCCWPTQASGNVVVLETADSMMNQPFLRWLREVYPKPPAKPREAMSMNELADAGEIEVIDCG